LSTLTRPITHRNLKYAQWVQIHPPQGGRHASAEDFWVGLLDPQPFLDKDLSPPLFWGNTAQGHRMATGLFEPFHYYLAGVSMLASYSVGLASGFSTHDSTVVALSSRSESPPGWGGWRKPRARNESEPESRWRNRLVPFRHLATRVTTEALDMLGPATPDLLDNIAERATVRFQRPSPEPGFVGLALPRPLEGSSRGATGPTIAWAWSGKGSQRLEACGWVGGPIACLDAAAAWIYARQQPDPPGPYGNVRAYRGAVRAPALDDPCWQRAVQTYLHRT